MRRLLVGVSIALMGCSGTPEADEDVGSLEQATTSPSACLSAPLAGECRYTPVKAYASSVENNSSAYQPSEAIDSDCGSRWSSAFSDPQWLKVDLGASRPLRRLVIHWEAAASSNYEIQVSENASTWTKVATKANAVITGSGNNRVDTISGLTASARYVRVYSLSRTTTYGNSVFELEVFGSDCATSNGCSSIPVVPVSATASSSEHAAKTADKAIDGNPTTRWSSLFSDPQWLQLDLGRSQSLGRVVIDWENATSSKYELQVSESPTGPWTVLHTHDDNRVGPRKDDITGLNGGGRYLRIHSTKRATTYGNSIFEVRVYRSSCSGCEQVLVPTATAASSTESTAYPASKAVDGDYSTRWSSQFSDPQWLRLDFGQARRINQVMIRWETSASKRYRIETAASSSGPWTTIAERSNMPAGPRWDLVSGLDGNARFLRVNSLSRTTTYGHSIYEIIVLGSASTVCSGSGTCVETDPPGQKECDCNARRTGPECGTTTVPDGDGDGTDDLNDRCPTDPSKTDPQICGCNVSDVDSDLDLVPDCFDYCDADPNNQIATPCGCQGEDTPLQPVGKACMVEACSGSRQEAACSAQGECGAPNCAPLAQGCEFVIFRDHGYWLCSGNVSWQQAETLCGEEPGRSLVQVNDRIENVWLAKVLGGENWLGGNELVQNDRWAWSYNGIRDEAPFWANNAAAGGRYTNWQAGAPGGGQCLKMLDNGDWVDAACSQTRGFVCEQPVLQLPVPIDPPCACDYFPGVSCDTCGVPGEPVGDCVDAADVFPHSPGNVDTDNPNPDFDEIKRITEDCKLHCTFEGDPDCATHCPDFASVPPPGTCFAFSATQRALCELESVHPDPAETCSLEDQECPGDYRCGRVHECAWLDGDYEPRRCRDTIDCPSGTYCGDDPKVCIDFNKKTKCDTHFFDANGVKHCVGICFGRFACGIPRPECAVYDDDEYLDPCSTTEICPDPGSSDLAVDPIDDDNSNLDPQPFPADTFFPEVEDEVQTPFEGAKPPNCGTPAQPCGYGVKGGHPWCKFEVEENQDIAHPGVSDASAPFEDKRGSGGSTGPIRFDFDPNLDIGYNVSEPLPLGDAQFGAHANASATAGAHFSLFGIDGDVSILDAAAGLAIDRCGVSHEARLKLFGLDFLPTLMGDSYEELSALDTPEADRQLCKDKMAEVQQYVDRAKKALRDAQELIRQYNEVVAAGKRLSPDLCAQLLDAGVPEGFPTPAAPFQGCDDLTPKQVVDMFVAYYEEQVYTLIREQARLIPESLPDFTTYRVDFLDAVDETGQVDNARRETQQIANINFAIGPIPMNLTIEAFVQYGIAGDLTFSLTPQGLLTAYDSKSPEPLAGVDASITPFAGAGVTLFIGVGFDWGALSAKAGIEGEVSLGRVSLPIYAGAGIQVKAEDDIRPQANDMASIAKDDMLFPKGKPKKFTFQAAYKFGVSAEIADILRGSISAKLRIKFFWFSKSWQKQIASFGPALDPITIKLIHGSGSADFADATGVLGFIHQPLTFVDFKDVLDPGPLPPLGGGGSGAGGDAGDDRYVPFDFSRVEKIFYDGFCDCGGLNDTCTSDLGCCEGTTCMDSDTIGHKSRCLTCIPEKSVDFAGLCETHDDCCPSPFPERPNRCYASNPATPEKKFCDRCVSGGTKFVDINGDLVPDSGECCPGLRGWMPPGDTRPECFSCNHQNFLCNVPGDCCDLQDPTKEVTCENNRCSFKPAVPK